MTNGSAQVQALPTLKRSQFSTHKLSDIYKPRTLIIADHDSDLFVCETISRQERSPIEASAASFQNKVLLVLLA